MPHKLAIITVVYENYTVLQDFLKSLEKQSNKNFKLFIVDQSLHRQKISIKEIDSTVMYGNNKGYSYGINIGIKKAIEEKLNLFCILNNDTYFREDFVDAVFQSILKYPSSIIGGKIYYAPGYEYHKKKYKKEDLGKVIWFAGGKIDWNHALTPHFGVDEIDDGQFNKFREVEFINGAFMLFDSSVTNKVGLWDEGYFLYFEDADFCVRAKRSGIKIYYDPSLIIWHKNSQSTGGSGSDIHIKFQKVNRLKFGLKYAPIRTKLHLIINYFFRKN